MWGEGRVVPKLSPAGPEPGRSGRSPRQRAGPPSAACPLAAAAAGPEGLLSRCPPWGGSSAGRSSVTPRPGGLLQAPAVALGEPLFPQSALPWTGGPADRTRCGGTCGGAAVAPRPGPRRAAGGRAGAAECVRRGHGERLFPGTPGRGRLLRRAAASRSRLLGSSRALASRILARVGRGADGQTVSPARCGGVGGRGTASRAVRRLGASPLRLQRPRCRVGRSGPRTGAPRPGSWLCPVSAVCGLRRSHFPRSLGL